MDDFAAVRACKQVKATYFSPSTALKVDRDLMASGGGANLAKLGSMQSNAGINQSAILWGATDFLLQRAGDEANIWFLNSFVSDVCDSQTDGSLRGDVLFRRSCAVLRTLAGASVTYFPSALVALRDAMKTDLYYAPYIGLAFAGRQAPSDERRDELYLVAELSFLGALMLDGNSASNAIVLLSAATAILDAPGDQALSCSKTPIAAEVYQTAMFLSAFPIVDGGFKVPQAAKDGFLVDLAYAVLAFQANVASLKKAKAWPQDCSAHGTFDFDPVHLMEVGTIICTSMYELGWSREVVLSAAKARTTDKLAALGRIISSAVMFLDEATVPLLSSSQSKTLHEVASELTPRLSRVANGDFLSIAEMLTVFARGAAEKSLPPDYSRMISLSADVMVAQTPDAVQKALSMYAAPASAYRTKHSKGHTYVELNGYVAAGGGYEFIKDPGTFSFGQRSLAAGPALPIGVELGVSTAWGAFGLLLQAVDLGALATYRFKETDASQAPEVGVTQVLAPGAFVAWGIPKSPLSILAGVDLVPRLRTVGATASERDVARASLRIGFDIPILP